MSIAVAQPPRKTPETLREATETQFEYPGLPTTCDGAEAVVHVEVHVAQAAGAYPITSSTTMGGGFNAAVMNGQTNLWGDPLMFFEPESEHSAATVCEGFAVAGGRVTNFTSGQGLVLMKEVLYTISGKRLPVLMNIGARALTSQGLNVHAGHDDVMSVADCGWGMLFARNAQEAGDFCLICRRAAEATCTPFFNVQDGFLTTHTVESVRLSEPAFMKEYIGDPKEKLTNLMDTANPLMSGVVQNQDSYMKGKIAQRWYYDQVEPALEEAFALFTRKTGRRYGFVEAYRCEDAEYILVGMGCYMETAKVTADYLRDKLGIKAGVLTVFVFRPFPARQIVEALKHCKAFTVFERMDDPLSTTGNHLTREIKAAFCDAVTGQNGQSKIERVPRIYGAAAGLGSRDVRPGDIIAAFQNMMKLRGQDFFCVGIDHALALKRPEDPDLRPRHRRQRLRQGRAGLPQVRLGEEGPADDVLPDHRRFAHHDAQRTGARGPAVHQRPDGHPQPAHAGRPAAGRQGLHAVSARRPGAGVEAHPRARAADHPRAPGADLLHRHGADRARGGHAGRPADAHAGHRAAGSVLAADALRHGKPDDRRAGVRRRGESAAQVLRQTG
jgi:pyruvate-ferredoxin/flavodoxin oxidoreductase